MPIDQATLGAAIKEVRTVRGLTQLQLAKRLGFSSGGVALIEQGKRAVSMATLNAVAKALELPPGCLAILGSRSGGKSKPLADFIESLKQTISALIIAQSAMAAGAQKDTRKKQAVKKVARSRNRSISELAPLTGILAMRPAKGKPSRSASHKAVSGR